MNGAFPLHLIEQGDDAVTVERTVVRIESGFNTLVPAFTEVRRGHRFSTRGTRRLNRDSITAAAQPTISGDDNFEDATLTGWTTSVAAGDVLGFNVDSCTTITRVTVELWVTRP